ncbi:hypothetical protein [Desulfopila sp. IMCC35008]|uniref:hypothetical protein n=1 Tax=Desulfopila sp. IMCC35008 TaxID=2653858 RepID=UPI0013D0AD2C|nr:hypothetical protein [Desulfopila sp. IMCC35008]
MKSRLSLRYYLRLVIIVVMASSLSLQTAFAQTASPPQNSADTPTTDEAFSAPTPEESAESSSTKTWLLVGGAVAIGLGAVALGSGGGGGDSSTATEPVIEETQATSSSSNDEDQTQDDDDDDEEIEEDEPDTPYTGPDLNGSWNGFVNLVNEGNENVSVSASVSQDGKNISISTSSPYSYARSFSGKISSSGDIKVKDNNTGEIWTTHSGAASANSIRLFDWVNDYTDLDRLELSR